MSGNKNRKLDQSEMEKVSGGTLNSYDAVYHILLMDNNICFAKKRSVLFGGSQADN